MPISQESKRERGLLAAEIQQSAAGDPRHAFNIDVVLDQLEGEVRAFRNVLIASTVASPRRLRKRGRTIARYAVKLIEWTEGREGTHGTD